MRDPFRAIPPDPSEDPALRVSEARIRVRRSKLDATQGLPVIWVLGEGALTEFAAHLDPYRVTLLPVPSDIGHQNDLDPPGCDLLLAHAATLLENESTMELPARQILALGSSVEIEKLRSRFPKVIALSEGQSMSSRLSLVTRIAELAMGARPDERFPMRSSTPESPEVSSSLLHHVVNEIANVTMALQPSLAALEDLSQAEPLIIEHANAVNLAYQRLNRYVRDVNTLVAGTSTTASAQSLPVLEAFIDELVADPSPGTRFTSRLSLDLWPVGIGTNDLRTLCRQLIDNAMTATRRGGSVRFDADNVRLPDRSSLALAAGEYLRIRVTDDGIGMPESVLSRAKAPFFTTWGESAHWRGLGLTQVDAICRRGCGTLELRSRAGHGTVATALLRRAESSVVTASEPQRGNGVAPASHFLIVDDEPLVLAALHRGLAQLGHTVHLAQDAPTALAILEEGAACQYAVIDIHLGQMSGLDFADSLALRYPELRLVLTTGFHNSERVFAGATKLPVAIPVLRKPFDVGALLSLLSPDATLRKGR